METERKLFYTNEAVGDQSNKETINLVGNIPSKTHMLEEQVKYEYCKIQQQSDDYQRSLYLKSLYNRDYRLYFTLIQQYVEQLLPIIYTPTIAENVIHFSANYLGESHALYLDSRHPEKIEASLKQITEKLDTVDLMVITDGEGVLGIGDWGINSVEIAIGKACVYTVAAGIDPKGILPVIIDNGTNRKELIDSPIYLGKKEVRIEGEEYLKFLDQFVEISHQLFPNVLFHWEDFGRENAQVILDRYKDKVVTFNDDIQGTGITVVAAVNNALGIKKEHYREQKFVIFGAGTAGVGIAEQIINDMVVQGLSEKEAKDRLYLVDKKGVVTKDNFVTEGQNKFARSDNNYFDDSDSLSQIINKIKPSFLIGASGQRNVFDKKIVEAMLEYQEHPAVFPLSNPSRLSEATAQDIIRWSDGKTLVVTGSPSDPVTINGISYTIGQANNALFYPGLGLGIIASKATKVTDKMLSSAAKAGQKSNDLDRIGASLLPGIKELRTCSLIVAQAVFAAAVEDGVTRFDFSDSAKEISKRVWNPEDTFK